MVHERSKQQKKRDEKMEENETLRTVDMKRENIKKSVKLESDIEWLDKRWLAKSSKYKEEYNKTYDDMLKM